MYPSTLLLRTLVNDAALWKEFVSFFFLAEVFSMTAGLS